MRLDLYLTENGFESTRNRAKNLIIEGSVSVNGNVVTKPAFDICDSDKVEIIGEKLKYVGRGGLKLEKAINEFSIDVSGFDCIDIGASTGGFTDCLLQNGATHIYAVDVGTSQLDLKLKVDDRVTVLENTDARALTRADVPTLCDMATIDVSFISLTKIVEFILPFLKDTAKIVALIKPQFEAGRKNITKNGIVTSEKVRTKVIDDLTLYFNAIGLTVSGVTVSPIKGGDGNIEYLMLLSRGGKI